MCILPHAPPVYRSMRTHSSVLLGHMYDDTCIVYDYIYVLILRHMQHAPRTAREGSACFPSSFATTLRRAPDMYASGPALSPSTRPKYTILSKGSMHIILFAESRMYASTTPTHHRGRCLINLQSRQASSMAGRKQKRQVGSCSTTLECIFLSLHRQG